jgi:hypothetical protein
MQPGITPHHNWRTRYRSFLIVAGIALLACHPGNLAITMSLIVFGGFIVFSVRRLRRMDVP